MKQKTVKLICLTLCLLLLFLGSSCGGNKTSPDEIFLNIELDLEEDIGLLLIDWQLGNDSGSGGMSNADKTSIARDEKLDFSFDKSRFENANRPLDLTLNFTVSTEYFEPNFENVYPEEYLIRLEPVSFEAEFGNSYDIVISGGKNRGYKAEVKNP